MSSPTPDSGPDSAPNAPPAAESIDRALASLQSGADRWTQTPAAERMELIDRCLQRIIAVSPSWVELSCQAKRIPVDDAVAAEEILSGPVATMRYLQLMRQALAARQRAAAGSPNGTPGAKHDGDGTSRVCVVPARGLYDLLSFFRQRGEVHIADGTASGDGAADGHGHGESRPQVELVLGAGNVSAIAATDALTKVFQDDAAVLLKLNPVNDYLEPVLRDGLQPLIEAGLLQLACGGAAFGQAVLRHSGVSSVHITGSPATFQKIVWGPTADERARRQQTNDPLLTIPITSELGNVTPWIVVPGRYSARQLRLQVEQIIASMVNNAGFNCVTTRVIITHRGWPQRDEFLALLQKRLAQVPQRYAYYPGARERFERYAGNSPNDSDDGTLPWTLLTDVHPETDRHLFAEESFVCVYAETALDGPSDPAAFLTQATEFVNERLFGTLAAAMTLPPGFRHKHRQALRQAIQRLRYGVVCINVWPGVAFGAMAIPWGGAPGTSLASPQSGQGFVHNPWRLAGVQKSVLRGPLTTPVRPVWSPFHRRAHRAAWSLQRLYAAPSLTRLPALLLHGVRE